MNLANLALRPSSRFRPLFAAVLLQLCACDQPNSSTSVPPAETHSPASSTTKTSESTSELTGLRAAIYAEIGTAACTIDDQCQVIGIGARPCGGPEAYLAWSTAHTDQTRLKSAVDRHIQAAIEFNQRNGLVSTCQVEPVPTAKCLPSTTGTSACQLQPVAAAPAVH